MVYCKVQAEFFRQNFWDICIDITADLIYNNIGNEVLPRMLYILNRLFKLMTSAIFDAGIVSFFCVFRRYFYVD